MIFTLKIKVNATHGTKIGCEHGLRAFQLGDIQLSFDFAMFLNSLYREERLDGSNSGVKWTCPNIHDLMNILEKVKVDLILDTVFNKRLSKLEDLSVVQLREECAILNIDKKGKRVRLFVLK